MRGGEMAADKVFKWDLFPLWLYWESFWNKTIIFKIQKYSFKTEFLYMGV